MKDAKLLSRFRESIRMKFFGYHICVADTVLDTLCSRGSVPKSIFFSGAPADAEDIIFYLTSKGLVKDDGHSLKVTTEGWIYHQKKGFSGDIFRHLVITAFAVIGSVCAIVSTALQCLT